MATLKENAQTYEPKKRTGVADLKKIPVNLELFDGKKTNMKGEEYSYKYILVDGVEYRIPGTVLGGIKVMLEKMPHIEFVTVTKTGTTKEDTEYSVFPYIEQNPVDKMPTTEEIVTGNV